MRVGIIQSSYIPWRGYFDFISDVDVFVFHDDIQFTKSDWRNRNKIKTSRGLEWLTVPVHHNTVSQTIIETNIDNSRNWKNKHLGRLFESYRNAPYYKDAETILYKGFERSNGNISELNTSLVRLITNYLNIEVSFFRSDVFGLKGTKTERLIQLLKSLNADIYLSGPSADIYLDKELFRSNEIKLEYKSYDYSPYPQQWGEFNGQVSIIDLIANCGKSAIKYLNSNSPNIQII